MNLAVKSRAKKLISVLVSCALASGLLIGMQAPAAQAAPSEISLLPGLVNGKFGEHQVFDVRRNLLPNLWFPTCTQGNPPTYNEYRTMVETVPTPYSDASNSRVELTDGKYIRFVRNAEFNPDTSKNLYAWGIALYNSDNQELRWNEAQQEWITSAQPGWAQAEQYTQEGTIYGVRDASGFLHVSKNGFGTFISILSPLMPEEDIIYTPVTSSNTCEEMPDGFDGQVNNYPYRAIGLYSYLRDDILVPEEPIGFDDNADLAGLAVSGATLDPAFDPDVLDYTTDNVTDSQVTIDAPLSNPGARSKINGEELPVGTTSADVDLACGLNEIEIEVTATDRIATKTYTVEIRRICDVPNAPEKPTVEITGAGTTNVTIIPSPDTGPGTVAPTHYSVQAYLPNGDPAGDFCDDVPAGNDPLTSACMGLEDDVAYTYKVVAYGGVGESAPSPASDPVVANVPDAPLAPTAQATGLGEIEVTVVPAPTGGTPDTYVVKAYDADGDPAVDKDGNPVPDCTIPANQNPLTCQFTNLDEAAGYKFQATAQGFGSPGTDQTSPDSNLVIPGVPPTPEAPDVTLGNANGQVVVTINKGSGDVPVTKYVVTSSNGYTPITCEVPEGPDPLTCEITGLVASAPATFTVKAFNGPIESAASEPSEPIVPRIPQNVNGQTATITGPNSVKITFNAGVSPSFGAVDYFEVTVPVGSPAITPCRVEKVNGEWPSVLECELTGLTANAVRSFRINAYNNAGASTNAMVNNVFVGVPNQPAKPTAALVGTGEIKVTWVAPAVNTTGGPISSYEVVALDEDGNPALDEDGQPVAPCVVNVPGTLECSFTGLDPAEGYKFTVVAQNGAGDSLASVPSDMITPQGPETPLKPTASLSGPGTGKVLVTITPPADTTGITKYVVTSNAQPTAQTCEVELPASELACMVNGLPAELGSTFTVVAYAGDVASDPSVPSDPIIPNIPAVPTNTQAERESATSALVTFDAGQSLINGEVESYEVTSAPDGITCTVTKIADEWPTPLGCVVEGLTTGTNYTFTVVAKNAAGDSAASDPSNELESPTVTEVVPENIAWNSTDRITIKGTLFLDAPSVPTVTIGGEACTDVQVVNSGELTCIPPEGMLGSKTVVVTNADGGSGSLEEAINYISTPTIDSISPIAGNSTGGTEITITGEGFEDGLEITVGGVACAPTTYVSATEAKCVTPAGSVGEQDIVLTNPDAVDGLGEVTAPDAFHFVEPPSIDSLDVDQGLSSGGTEITITGDNFVGGGDFEVLIGGKPCNPVAVVSPTEITCTTPAGDPGPQDIVINNGDGGTTTLDDGFTYLSVPTIESISPTSGVEGDTITIEGTQFMDSPAPSVTVGGVPCDNIVVVSSTTITCEVPANPDGPAQVVVTNDDGGTVTADDEFNYVTPPTISNVLPPNGSTSGGTQIMIEGTGFKNGVEVTVGGRPCVPVQFLSSQNIRCTVPASADGQTGANDIVVTNPDGGSVTESDGFTYDSSNPVINDISPSSGNNTGGTEITITGSDFGPDVVVEIGGEPCTNLVRVSLTEITCTTPAGTDGATEVKVINKDGSEVSDASGFTFVTPPAVSSVSPNSGSNKGGDEVTLRGGPFHPGVAVKIGGKACAPVALVSESEIKCKTPSGVNGKADIVVTNTDGGITTVSDAFTYVTAADDPKKPAKPNKPARQKISGKPNAKKFKVSWSLPKGTSASRPVTGFRLTVQQRGKKKIIILRNLGKKTTSYTLTRKQLLRAVKKYNRLSVRGETGSLLVFTVKVSARNASGWGAPSTSRLIMKR